MIDFQINNQELNTYSDTELVALSLSKADNFAFLIERYKSKIGSYIKRLTNIDDDDLEDVLQEIFIKVYINLNGFDKNLQFSSWIYRIAHNEVISRHRKLKARPEGYKVIIDEELANSLAAEIDIKGGVDKKILQNNIGSVLSAMSAVCRELIVLKFLEEKSYQEISDILKKPLGTVASLMNKAKKEFRTVSQQKRVNL